jgi:hypothetical protein
MESSTQVGGITKQIKHTALPFSTQLEDFPPTKSRQKARPGAKSALAKKTTTSLNWRGSPWLRAAMSSLP